MRIETKILANGPHQKEMTKNLFMFGHCLLNGVGNGRKKMNQEKINQLLSILDLPPEEQRDWILVNVAEVPTFSSDDGKKQYPIEPIGGYSLADLAFQLRNEVANGKVNVDGGDLSAWYTGLIYVQNHLGESDGWFMHRSQPIHWIITALIAKESEKKDERIS